MFKVIRQLAWSNLGKNKQLYLPFGLVIGIAVVALLNLNLLAASPDILNIHGGQTIRETLKLGVWVLGITVLALMLYANSFVFKQRTKDYGVFSLLGLERRHLLSLIWWELTIFFVISASIGFGVGIMLYQLILTLFQRIMNAELHFSNNLEPSALLTSGLLLVGLYGILLGLNSWKIRRIQGLQLVKEKTRGERPPRPILLLGNTLLGSGLMVWGYWQAITLTHPVQAIQTFFMAVLAVIAGTYLLFDAGSLVLLRCLQKRKNFYYRLDNFISVSNLIFRMRKNAAGLASICLLSTMALVSLSAGLSLYFSVSHTVEKQLPHQYGAVLSYKRQLTDYSTEDLAKTFTSYLTEHQVQPTQTTTAHYLNLFSSYHNGVLTPYDSSRGIGLTQADSIITYIIDTEDYQRLTGDRLSLSNQEIALYHSNSDSTLTQLTIGSQTYAVKQSLSHDVLKGQIANAGDTVYSQRMLLVVNNTTQFMKQLATTTSYDLAFSNNYYVGVQTNDVASSDSALSAQTMDTNLVQRLQLTSEDTVKFSTYNRQEVYQTMFALMGSLFFIGSILAMIFLLGMTLTIYYKQISEGMEDANRFDIMVKVGLSKGMIRRTIRKQVIIVFFAPIIVALCHLAGAYHMMRLILNLIGTTDNQFILMVTLSVSACMVLFYGFIFWFTSRSYAKIIAHK